MEKAHTTLHGLGPLGFQLKAKAKAVDESQALVIYHTSALNIHKLQPQERAEHPVNAIISLHRTDTKLYYQSGAPGMDC